MISKPGFQRGMRFLRWAATATDAEVKAAIAPKTKARPPLKCYRCQGGRGLHLCGSCAVTVKSIFRRYQRGELVSRRKAREVVR